MTDSCATCFFFASQTYTDDSGNVIAQNACRRNAPHVSNNPGQAKWPFVQSTDWCGDFLTTYPLASFGTWQPWTSAISAASGSLTSFSQNGRFCQIGNLINFTLEISITTNGSGATSIIFTTPTQAKNTAAFVGYDLSNVKALVGKVIGGGSIANFVRYDGTYPGGDGYDLFVAGCYESKF